MPGRGAGGGVGLRLIPGKALFFRRGRKLFAGKRRRRVWWFAPWSRESLISPLRGANRFPGSRRGVGARNPASLDFSFPLHQVVGLFHRLTAPELVHGSPQSLNLPFPLHQVVGLFRRLGAPDLVHGTPQGLDFPFPLHQELGLFRRLGAPELVNGSPQGHDFPFPLHQELSLFRRLAPTFWLFTKKVAG